MADEDALVPLDDDRLPALSPATVASVTRYALASRADSTREKYKRDWAAFSLWCRAQGRPNLPAAPETVAAYVSEAADRGLSPSTVNRIVAAIGYTHRLAGLQPPQKTDGGQLILSVLAGIRRSHGKPPVRKAAADSDVVRDVLRSIKGDTLKDFRDRAIIAFGMACALRRSELVALTVADLTRTPRGMDVRISRSKTDQEGKGVTIAVPDGRRLRPVAHLLAWLEWAGITEGPLFRNTVNGSVSRRALSDQSVGLIVKRRVAAAGYAPGDFSAHSLRSGFLTSAAAAGSSIWKMRDVSRHKSVQVLSDYVRASDRYTDHAGEDFL
ncbi:site-specific integrase [Roseomonas sp. BN140053]|uniref:site-specific integrase n=1 Tax=Roseomonas sp. BN140053 TaxID=3391898 RepID=UPI0039E9B54A